MLRLAFDFIITWRETRTRPNAYSTLSEALLWGCAITGMGAVMIRPSASRYLGRMMRFT